MEVAVAGSNTLVELNAAAGAMGDQTATFSLTSTLAVPFLAVGAAVAGSVAYDAAPASPQTNAATAGLVAGGDTIGSYNSHRSIDFAHGPTPVSVEVSTTFISTHGGGNALDGYSLHDLTSPSLHGLF
jgi:hypothetical protein